MRLLRYYGDPALRRKARPVREITEEVRSLAREMFALMRRHRGIGLAANQVGERVRVIVVDLSAGERERDAFAIVNPKVVRRTGSYEDEEGCLSFPGLRLPVRRPLEARVEGLDLGGNPVAHEGRGLLARALLHEIDHLDGVLFTARLPWAKRIAMWFRLPALKRSYRNRPAEAEESEEPQGEPA